MTLKHQLGDILSPLRSQPSIIKIKLEKRKKKKGTGGWEAGSGGAMGLLPFSRQRGERSRGPQPQRAARQLAWFTIHAGRREPAVPRASRIVPFTVLNCQQKACASAGPSRKAAPAAPSARAERGIKP